MLDVCSGWFQLPFKLLRACLRFGVLGGVRCMEWSGWTSRMGKSRRGDLRFYMQAILRISMLYELDHITTIKRPRRDYVSCIVSVLLSLFCSLTDKNIRLLMLKSIPFQASLASRETRKERIANTSNQFDPSGCVFLSLELKLRVLMSVLNACLKALKAVAILHVFDGDGAVRPTNTVS